MTVPEVLPASKTPAFWPAQPDALADLDISPTLVQDLFVRTVREQGQSSLGSLRERLKLPHMVLERSEEHTSELQSLRHLVCRLLLEKKKKKEIKNASNGGGHVDGTMSSVLARH